MSAVPNAEQVLSEDARRQIDHWVAKYPADRKRSAVIPALHVLQDGNGGFLTEALMDALAEYLELPPVQAARHSSSTLRVMRLSGVVSPRRMPSFFSQCDTISSEPISMQEMLVQILTLCRPTGLVSNMV